MNQEDFAKNIRVAGTAVGKAEYELGKADADEKRTIATSMMRAEHNGAKTNAAQLRASDEDITVYEVRLARGKAKGLLAAAKSEMLAAEVEFGWTISRSLVVAYAIASSMFSRQPRCITLTVRLKRGRT